MKIRKFISWLHKNHCNLLIMGLFFGCLCMIAITQIKIIFLNSESIPYSVCLQVYNLKPEKGDLCILDFKGRTFVKYLIGKEGGVILNKGNEIFVEGKRLVGVQRTLVLTPIESGTIPKGYIFVAGTHENSLDSRYIEFGLVPISAIKGKAFGLWKWKES